jgi:N-methylhydantoinase B
MDQITAQVINGRLSSIALEMSRKLVRTGFSILIKESEDIGCALVAADGWQLAEADTTPLQMGPLPFGVQGMLKVLEERGEEVRPGDVFIHNDPYLGASHSPDIDIILPVFHEDRLVAYACTTAHHIDIGCSKPGTSVLDAIDDWAGGIRLRALKVREDGRDLDQVWHMISDNVRLPELVVGDLRAQVGAAEIGAQRLLELIDEVGLDAVLEAKAWAEDYSERMLREEIAALPDGEYYAEGKIDGYPDDPDPSRRDLKIACTIRVTGDELEIDLTGTAPQLDDRPLNMPFEGTVTVVALTVMRTVLLDTDNHEFVPQNRGIMRPFTLTAPLGCMVNPSFPAPTLSRSTPACVLADVILKAFAEIVPDRCCAGIGILGCFAYQGVLDGAYWGHWDIYEGSYGARLGKDGMDAMDTLFTNTRCAPVEEIETESPLRVRHWQLNDNPIGHGRFRGGVGGRRDFEFLVDGLVALETDGHTFSPWGLGGGRDGWPGSSSQIDPDGTETPVPSKLPPRPARKGQIYRAVSANGGGYGDPLERDPEAVLGDFLDGFITIEDVEQVYAVALGRDGRSVDAAATGALRDEARTAATR